MRDLLAQFVAAIAAEIALVERESRDQSYELLSGQRDEKSTGTLYVFLLADPLRLPEDAYGTLQTDGKELSAMVVAQEGNRVWLLLESAEPLPLYLGAGRLVLNQTDLLRRLKEKIQLLQADSDLGLAPSVFGYVSSTVSATELPPRLSERLDDSRTRAVLQQALGSDVTFVWGPPGTGKTFTIAALVASLAELNETVLVTSHTHAAVEQALWALIERPFEGRAPGFLHRSPLVDEGRILKVGPLRAKDKFPPEVQLDSYLEQKAKERDADIEALQQEYDGTVAQYAPLERQIAVWRAYEDTSRTYNEQLGRFEEARAAYARALEAVELAQTKLAESESRRQTAQSSFFIGRGGRVAKARRETVAVQNELTVAQTDAATAHARGIRMQAEIKEEYERALEAHRATKELTPLDNLEARVRELRGRADAFAAEIEALRVSLGEEAKTLVREAVAIFVTLTNLSRKSTAGH